MPRSPLLRHLRTGTRAAHDALEAGGPGRRLTGGRLTPRAYEAVVAWQRVAHAAAEVGLERFDWPATYGYRSRRPSLAAEAVHEPGAPPPPPPLTPPPTLAAAVGRAYALEGSALGGNVILGHLQRNRRLAPYAPFPFYRFQRDIGLAQWRAFGQFVSERDWSPREREEAVAEAGQTFDVFRTALGVLGVV